MKKALLLDATILRPMAILLLVIFHAFIIYNGGWKAPLGYVDVEPYRYIADITEERMRELAQPMIKNQYGQYLLKVIDELKETGKSNLD